MDKRLKPEILNKVLADLNLTPEQMLEEGFMDTIKNSLMPNRNADQKIGDVMNPIAMGASGATGAANPNEPGIMLKDPQGKFIKITGVQPNSKQYFDIMRQYQSQGYTGVKPGEADGKPFETHAASEGNIQGNLKQIVASTMTDLKNTAGELETKAASMPTITSQDAGGMFNQFNNKLLAGARKAQAFAGKQAPHPPYVAPGDLTQPQTAANRINVAPVTPMANNPGAAPAAGSSVAFQPGDPNAGGMANAGLPTKIGAKGGVYPPTKKAVAAAQQGNPGVVSGAQGTNLVSTPSGLAQVPQAGVSGQPATFTPSAAPAYPGLGSSGVPTTVQQQQVAPAPGPIKVLPAGTGGWVPKPPARK